MSENSDAYERVAYGAGIVLFGNIFGMGFAFLTRVVPARWLSPSEYGLFALGVTILSATALLGNLGLYEGIARNIPRSDNPDQVFTTGLLVAIGFSVTLGGAIILLSPLIAARLLGTEFTPILRVVGIGIPLMVVFKVITGGFRGREDAVGRVATQNFLMRGSIFALVLIGITLGYGAMGATVGWVVGLTITAVGGLSLLEWRNGLLAPLRDWREAFAGEVAPLVRFSLPLMGAATIWQLLQETDNLFIGYYLQSADLGVYDAAFTLGRLVMLFFWPVGFLLLPVFSNLETAKNQDEINHLYTLITKWMTALTLPVVLFLATFPKLILSTVFTPSFGRGGIALTIIAVTFFTHVVAGANRQTLTALGNSTAVFKGMIGALFLNILLNILLIPQLGVEGAALATAISYGLLNVFYNILLYMIVDIQPFTWRLATTLGVGLFLFAGVHTLFQYLIEPTFWRVFSVAIGYTFVYAIAFVFTGGLEPKDAELLVRMDEKIPVDLRPLIQLAEE